jgi:predicted DNA-binding antitoxin AbrB/MazE fold protein
MITSYVISVSYPPSSYDSVFDDGEASALASDPDTCYNYTEVIVMKRVKGIYQNNVVKLLEKVDAEEGSEVEVIFPPSYQAAKMRQLRWLIKGFHMGKIIRQSRDELHER